MVKIMPNSTKQSILVIIQHFHPVKLGPYTRLVNFISKSKRFHFIIPTVPEDIGPMPDQASHIELIYLHPHPNSHRHFLFYFFVYLKLCWHRKKEIKVCYCISPPAYFALAALGIKLLFRIPYVIDIGDPWVNNAVSLGKIKANPFLIWFPRFIEKIVLYFADSCVLTSPELSRTIPTLQCKSHTLFTGIDSQLFHPNGRAKHMGDFRIVYAGTIGPLQELEKFLDVFSKIIAHHPHTELIILGMDEQGALDKFWATINRLGLNKQVRWEGLVTYFNVPRYLAEADLGLVMLKNDRSLDYAIPTKTFEYCMSGLPIFAIGGSALRNLLKESDAGVYVESTLSPDRIADKLTETIHSSRLIEYSRNGRIFAENILDSSYYARQLDSILESVRKNKTQEFESLVSSGIYWLLETDIRNRDKTSSLYGSFCHHYDLSSGRYSWTYNEITAYSISLLLHLYDSTQDRRYWHWAKRAGEYLLTQQCLEPSKNEFGAIPFGIDQQTMRSIPHYYSFDAGIVLNAFCDLYLQTSDSKYLVAAKQIGDFLIGKMQLPDGSFLSYYDSDKEEWSHNLPEFQYDGACLHAKLAIGLWKLGSLSNTAKYYRSAIQVCDWVLSCQTDSGAISTKPNVPEIYSHSHLYAMEGLLFLYQKNGNEKYLEAVQKAIQWTMTMSASKGALLEKYFLGNAENNHHARMYVTDAAAQAARMECLLFALTGDKHYLYHAKKSLQFLRSAQCQDNKHSNAFGGIYSYIRDSFPFDIYSPLQNTWSTQFAIQAALYYQDCLDAPNFDNLINKLF
jgi:colanic acid biosynthesis glycosyl transferase WcaI